MQDNPEPGDRRRGEGGEVNLTATASDQAQVTLAGRDVHIHYGEARRAISAAGADAECPYPGLAPFEAPQSRWFFGRDALTARLTALLAERITAGGPLTVVGPSGAGKSSLLRAGLLPAIAERGALPERGSAQWPQLLMTPGTHPLAELQRQLEDAGDARRLVIVVDQLEELFTLCPDEGERRDFIESCAGLARAGGRALVVFGVRADAYQHCIRYPALAAALADGVLLVGPMSLPELRQAIELPAREAGLELEPGLADLMLRDLGVIDDQYEAGRLPLLGYALRATWQERHGHLLTFSGYQATGGIRNAVATAAERAYAGLDRDGSNAAPGVFLRLVRIGDDTGDTRRAVALAGLADGEQAAVVDAFTQARLLTRDESIVTITHEALLTAWPRLAEWIQADRAANLHRQEVEEAAAAWERAGRDPGLMLRGARLEHAGKALGQLSATARSLYAASARQRARGRRLRIGLAAALALLAVLAVAAAGIAIDQEDVAHGQAALASSQASRAQAELTQAVVANLVFEASRYRDEGKSALAADLDLIAYRHWRGTSLARQDPGLYAGLVIGATRQLTDPAAVAAQAGSAWGMAFSATGNLLAVAGSGLGGNTDSAGNFVQLWGAVQTAHPRLLSTFATPTPSGNYGVSLAISPDGQILVIADSSGDLGLWNIASPRSPVPMQVLRNPYPGSCGQSPQQCGTPGAVAMFSAARVLVVTWPASLPLTGQAPSFGSAHADNGTRIYEITKSGRLQQQGGPLALHAAILYAEASDPVDHVLVAGDWAGRALRIWNVSDPARPRALSAPISVSSPLFSAYALAGDRLAVYPATSSGGIQLWTVPAARKIYSVATVSGGVAAGGIVPRVPASAGGGPTILPVELSQDGRTLAVADADNEELSVWDVAGQRSPVNVGEPLVFPVGTGVGPTFALNADGTLVATQDDQNSATVRLSDLSTADDVRDICAMPPAITPANWHAYVPDLPYSPPC